MSGRIVALVIVIVTAVFGAGLWYAQVHAFYEEIEAERINVQGESYPVSDWRGIDASSSPLKLRACFRLPEAAREDIAARLEPYPEATPLVPPGWFDCFDAGRLTADLEAGRATAYLAEEEEFEGANRILAVYPDGRAYMWRQLTPEFANQ
jgi:hypothetical protein